MKRIALVSVFFIMMMGCASKFSLELNSFINTNESYYTVWNPPIKEGGSGYSVYIVLDEKTGLNMKQIELQGIYFKDTYSALKYQKPRLYQGFIKNKASIDTFEMEGALRNQTGKKEVTEEIPFKLTGQEAVIVYKVKSVEKYIKIELRKKETLELPM